MVQSINTINDLKYKISFFLFVLGISLSISFFGSFKYLADDNYNYALGEIYATNSDIFSNNISILGWKNTPRYLSETLMSVIINSFQIDWFEVAKLIICLNYFLYALASTLFSISVFPNIKSYISCLLVSVAINSPTLIMLGFYLNYAQDVFLGTSIALGLIAISLIIRSNKHWDLAWIIVAVAEILHVHEGFWASSIILIIWIADCITEKKIQWKYLRLAVLYCLALLAVSFPSFMNGVPVDDRLFCDIYVYKRTSHHLLVSSWGFGRIIGSMLMLFGAVVPLYFDYKQDSSSLLKKRSLVAYSIALVFWLLLLVLEYVSTEVFCNSTIVTMYLPKCFKFITFLESLIYIYYGISFIEQNKYLSGLSLLGIVLIPTICSKKIVLVLFLLCFVGYLIFEFWYKVRLEKNKFFGFAVPLLLFVVAMIKYGISVSNKNWVFVFLLGLTIFLKEILDKYLYKKLSFLPYVVLFATLLVSGNNFIYEINSDGIKIVDGVDYFIKGCSRELYNLASDFKNKTNYDDVFIGDPYSKETNAFQLASQRSCYAIFKNTPSSKKAVIDWYQRITEISDFKTASPNKLKQLLTNTGCKYLLVTNDKFSEIESSNLFSLLIKNNSLGVYYIR